MFFNLIIQKPGILTFKPSTRSPEIREIQIVCRVASQSQGTSPLLPGDLPEVPTGTPILGRTTAVQELGTDPVRPVVVALVVPIARRLSRTDCDFRGLFFPK